MERIVSQWCCGQGEGLCVSTTTTKSFGMRGVVADRSVSLGFTGQAEVCDSKWLLEELCLNQLLTLSDYPNSRMK